MSIKQPSFQYIGSKKITNWGCQFDSLTELKYAISIIEEYEFLRERIVIYYERATREPTAYLRGNNSFYKPDFLIRNKTTGEAFLVEIKPRGFDDYKQLELRKELAEKYIKKNGFDWKFKIVYDDEIILTEEQLEDFKECCRLKSKSAFKMWFDQFKRKWDHAGQSPLRNASPEASVRFIMFGHTAQAGGWHS
jgi:hypothetical protein